jgi:hypothetical protein
MWMEWTIPIQKLEVSKIRVESLQKNMKPLTPLSYVDGPIAFQNLNILLPPLKIHEYDSTTGKLLLSLSDSSSTAAKLLALQECFLSAVYTNQRIWFPESNRTKDQIQRLFQSFVENTLLHLYCPLQIQEKRHMISIWKDGDWKRLSSPGLLQKGDSIRVALRLQGISYQLDTASGIWTGRFRVQHKIICIYHCPPPVILLRPKAVEEQKHLQP